MHINNIVCDGLPFITLKLSYSSIKLTSVLEKAMNKSSITKTLMQILMPVLLISLVGCNGGNEVVSNTRIG